MAKSLLNNYFKSISKVAQAHAILHRLIPVSYTHLPFDVPGHKRGRGNPELVHLLGEKCVGPVSYTHLDVYKRQAFKIYDVEDGKVGHSEVVDTNGSGQGALAGVLNALNADVYKRQR